jgi:hypothetical protein
MEQVLRYRDFGSFGQVLEDYTFQLPEELWPEQEIITEWLTITTKGVMTCLRGFIWDYATVPFTNWISNKLAGAKSKVPSLGHDALCRAKRKGLLPHDPKRKFTDRFFYDLLLARKFLKARAWAWWKSVQLGARWHKAKPRKVIEVT